MSQLLISTKQTVEERSGAPYPDVASYQHVPGLVAASVLSVELDGFEEGLNFTRLLLQEVWRRGKRSPLPTIHHRDATFTGRMRRLGDTFSAIRGGAVSLLPWQRFDRCHLTAGSFTRHNVLLTERFPSASPQLTDLIRGTQHGNEQKLCY